MEAINFIKNLFCIYLIILVSLCYCYIISSKLPKGMLRLISVIPILCIFTILPFHLCSIFAILSTSFSISWLCNFKLILFSFDQGPLSWQISKRSLVIFITVAVLPIKINESKYSPEKMKLPLNIVIEAFVFALLTKFLINYGRILSQPFLIILYSLFTMFLVDILLFCSCWIGQSITGFELDKPSKKPYLSTSMQEFWGRRWNLTVSNTLRHTIYFPVRAASDKVLGKGLYSTCIGVVATFVVSGLMHELIYYHMTLVATSGEVALYFVIHGVVVSIEIVWKKRIKDKLRLPWFVSCPLTVGFISITSWMLHFPHFIRTGVDVRLLEEFQICTKYLKTKILDFPSLSGVNLS